MKNKKKIISNGNLAKQENSFEEQKESELTLSEKKISTNIPFVYKLINTIFVCLLIFCFLLLGLYIMGNFQIFQDRSQELILNVLSYTGIFTSLLAFPLIVENIIMIITEKNKIRFILSLLFMIAGVIFCIFCIIFSNTLLFLSEGI